MLDKTFFCVIIYAYTNMIKKPYPIRSQAKLFKVLSDPTRLNIVMLLINGELCVCQIEAVMCSHQAKISRHLAYLRKNGMVKVRCHWKWKYYSLEQPKTHFEKSLFKCLKKWLQNEKPFKKIYGRMKTCLAQPLVEVAKITKKL